MLRASFELTYACNFACRHCYVPPDFPRKYRKKQLSTAGVLSVLDQLKGLGCLYLGFTGGEPFMRPDIFKILAYARSQGFEVIIYTNGSLIDAVAAKALARLRLNKVDITLPAMTEETFDLITGTSGMRAKVFAAITALHSQGVPLGFKTCLVKENKKEIRAISGFARSLKAEYRLSTSILPCLDGNTQPLQYAYTAEAGMAKRFPAVSHKYGCILCPETHPSDCGAATTQAAVTPAGEMKLCVLRHQPLYKLLGSDASVQWRRLRAYQSNKLCLRK